MYQKLEDWQDYSMTVENEAVENLAMIFRDHIEDHSPIQKELRIEVIDIIESYKFLNFATEPVGRPRHQTDQFLANHYPREGELQPQQIQYSPVVPHVPRAEISSKQRWHS